MINKQKTLKVNHIPDETTGKENIPAPIVHPEVIITAVKTDLFFGKLISIHFS